MSSPFLYFAGDRLSVAELASARLDGDVVEVGEAYMPADAVETRDLRAGSLRRRMPEGLALIRESAAWVHGAVPDAPERHTVQRRTVARVHHVVDARLLYRDQLLGAGDDELIGGVWVTTPARTLADLVRGLQRGEDLSAYVEAMLRWDARVRDAAIEVLTRGSRPHKRPAVAFLRAWAARAGQGDATRPPTT